MAFAEKMANDVVEALEVFTESKHVEVQERAVLAKTMLSQCRLCRKTYQKQQRRGTKFAHRVWGRGGRSVIG